jgi:hypothetical protein
MTTPWERIEEDSYKSWILKSIMSVEEYNTLAPFDRRSLQTQFEQQPEQQQQRVLRELVYRTVMVQRNGVAPTQFRDRVPATEILGMLLPVSIETFEDDAAIARIFLLGPPASGKTSIMGKIYATAKTRYSPLTPVYYVQAGELLLRRHEVTIAISQCP